MEFCIDVSGPYACFTRPEMKVERMSYDVITPSAARAIFDAIYWKPEIHWRITKIEVLNPIRWFSMRRNEIGSVMSVNITHIDPSKHRQQRVTLMLRDVRYRIYAEYDFTGKSPDNDRVKHNAIFERRASRGQHVKMPYFGCREFECYYTYVPGPGPLLPKPIDVTCYLGAMLLDKDYTNPHEPTPIWFDAKMIEGVIKVPPVKKPGES